MVSLPFETYQKIYIASVDVDGVPYTGSIEYSFQPDGQPVVWQSPSSDSGGNYFYVGPYLTPCIMHLYVQAQGPNPELPVIDGGRVHFY